MQFLGYFEDNQGTKVALLTKNKKKVTIDWTLSIKPNVKPFYILADRWGKVKPLIVSGLGPESLFHQKMTLPLTSRRALLSALPFQLEEILAYPVSEAALHPAITKMGKKSEPSQVLVMGTSKDKVQKHVDAAQIKPDIVTSIPLALFRYARHFHPELETLVIVHQKAIVLIESGEFAQTLLCPDKEQWPRMLAFIQKKVPENTPILFPDTPFEVDEARFTVIKDHNAFALPIGLALDGLLCDELSCQFKAEGSEESKRKEKKLVLHTALAAFCVFLLTWIFGGTGLSREKKALRAELEPISASKEKNLKKALASARTQLLQTPQMPLPTSVPYSVSECLAWLGHFSGDISIETLRYELEKYPTLGHNKVSPLVKVHLELTARSPRDAHDFHQALKNEKRLIDQKKGIKWSGEGYQYGASFSLLPRRDS